MNIVTFMLDFATKIIISISLFLLGIGSKQIYTYIQSNRLVYSIWGFKPSADKSIHMIAGNIEIKPYKYLLASGDVTAFAEVMSFVRKYYSKCKIFSFFSKEFPPSLMEKSLITIGGIPYNNITHCLQVELGDPFPYGRDTQGRHRLIDDRNEEQKIYYPIITTEVEKDYGIVMKVCNPFDSSNIAIILDGYTTYGVLAAAKTLCSVDNWKYAKKSFLRDLRNAKNFSFIVEANIIRNDVGAEEVYPKVIEESLMRWNPKSKIWEKTKKNR